MLLKPIIFPYKVYSEGARELAESFNSFCVYPDRKYRPRKNHLIVVWGAGSHPRWWPKNDPLYQAYHVLNNPNNVAQAINKRLTFTKLTEIGVSVPKWTLSKAEAMKWLDKDRIVVCRTDLVGSGGKGIVLARKANELVDAKLYSLHIRHKTEFRVHVFKGKVIDIAEKRRRGDFQGELSVLIRNIDKGWVFCHNDVTCPENVQQEAIKAVLALGLDFGAVDIGYREKEKKPYVFEVNTAPGIEGQTVQRYAAAIRELL